MNVNVSYLVSASYVISVLVPIKGEPGDQGDQGLKGERGSEVS